MRIEEGSFPSTGGMTDIHTVIWHPDGEPVGVIQIVHGMQEYALRYTHMAEWFCERGYLVCATDHLGHGQSLIDGKRGYFGEENTTETLVNDVEAFRKIAAQRFSGLPYFIFGHSMGSFITRLYLTKYKDGLSGVIISGTAGPNPAAKLAKPALRFLWKKNGGKSVNHFFGTLIPKMYNKKFADEHCKNAWLSSDLSVAEVYNKDKQMQFLFSVSALWTLMDLLDKVSQKSWAEKIPASLPVLLTSGADDPVGDFGEGVRTVYDRMMQAGCEDVSIDLYIDCRHELHNEPIRAQVFSDWLSWLTTHHR